MRRIPLTPVLCAIPLVAIAIFTIASAWIAPDATTQDVLLGVSPPGTEGHLLGTDLLGRDIMQLSIAGTRSAIIGPIVIALGSMAVGHAARHDLGLPARPRWRRKPCS